MTETKTQTPPLAQVSLANETQKKKMGRWETIFLFDFNPDLEQVYKRELTRVAGGLIRRKRNELALSVYNALTGLDIFSVILL